MFCTKCGKQITEDSKFCQSCGAPVEAEAAPAPTPAPEPVEAPAAEPMPAREPAPVPEPVPDVVEADSAPVADSVPVSSPAPKKGMSKPLLFGIIGGSVFLAAALATLVLVYFIVGGKTTYNLQDFTEITFDGVDGSGTASVKIDEEQLSYKIADGMGLDIEAYKKADALDFSSLGGDLDDIMELYNAVSSVKASVDKDSNLKNGDTVTITYTFDEEAAKKVKAEFVADPMTKTVSGLNEIKEIDPFESVQVSFEGTSPGAYLNWTFGDIDGLNAGAIYFEADKQSNLKLGDQVKISVRGYDEEMFRTTYGVRLNPTEKVYTVENVDAYITENAELDPQAVDIMKSASETYVKDYFEDSFRKKEIKGSDIKYEGYYFLTSRDAQLWNGYNKVYMIYSAKVSSKEKKKKFKPTRVYFPIQYDDVKKLASGTYEVETNYKTILGSTNLKFGFWQTVSGYTNKNTMKDELITADEESYQGAAYGIE